MNALLADPDQVNVARLLADGRIGLFVVSQLARRHGINVRLQTNIYGGVQAVLVVPQALLGAEAGAPEGAGQPEGGQSEAGAGAESRRSSSAEAAVPGGAGPGGSPDSGSAPASGSSTAYGFSSVSGAASEARPPVPPSAPAAFRAHQRETEPDSGGTPKNGHPAPLPVRGTRRERPTPAEARPGISPDDRRVLAGNVTEPLTPATARCAAPWASPNCPAAAPRSTSHPSCATVPRRARTPSTSSATTPA